MELKQLEAFVKVYELQSFSKAAQALFLSQPSVSAYILSLEKELQTQLLYRSSKELSPTKSGEVLYEFAKSMMMLHEKAVNSLQSNSDGTAGIVDILASSVPAQYILPELLGAFHKRYPNVVFNVKQMDTSDVVSGISTHKGEMGFVGAITENSKCVYEKLILEKLVLIAPNEERFEKVNPNEIKSFLKREYFVLREQGSGTRREYEEYLKKSGIKLSELKVSASFNNTQSIIHAVAGGLGVSIVSELAAKPYIDRKKVLSISVDSLPQRYFYIVLNKNGILSASAEHFLQFARSHMTE